MDVPKHRTGPSDANGPKTPDERQHLLSFQRYSYSTGSNPGAHRNSNSVLSQTDVSTRWQNVKTYFSADISRRWVDLILLVCFFISGLIDATAYNAYECFTSMQTGNTVFAALGVSNLPVSAPKLAYLKSLTSILAFLLGSLTLASFHRAFGARKRWVIVSSFTFQALVTLVAALLVANGASSESPARPPRLTGGSDKDGPNRGNSGIGFPLADLFPIALLSFQAAGKVVASRVLKQNGMPCVVLTTMYNDLMSQPGLLTAGLTGNVERNRKLGGVGFYLGGAVVGGVLARSAIGFAGALWITVGIKGALVIAWLLWRAEGEGEGDEER